MILNVARRWPAELATRGK